MHPRCLSRKTLTIFIIFLFSYFFTSAFPITYFIAIKIFTTFSLLLGKSVYRKGGFTLHNSKGFVVFCMTSLRQTVQPWLVSNSCWIYRHEPPHLAGILSSALWDGFTLGVLSACHAFNFPLWAWWVCTFAVSDQHTANGSMSRRDGGSVGRALATKPENLSSCGRRERTCTSCSLPYAHVMPWHVSCINYKVKCFKKIFLWLSLPRHNVETVGGALGSPMTEHLYQDPPIWWSQEGMVIFESSVLCVSITRRRMVLGSIPWLSCSSKGL